MPSRPGQSEPREKNYNAAYDRPLDLSISALGQLVQAGIVSQEDQYHLSPARDQGYARFNDLLGCRDWNVTLPPAAIIFTEGLCMGFTPALGTVQILTVSQRPHWHTLR